MKNKQYLPAFTILEVTIALLISSLVIAIAFTVLLLANKTMLRFNQRNTAIAAFLLTDKLLKKDFNTAGTITCTADEGLSITADSLQVIYEFTPAYLLRRQGNAPADTLRLNFSIPEITFRNKPCEPGGKVDEIHILATLEGKQLHLHAHKYYSAQELFN